MKTNKIANFKVKDLPTLKNVMNKVTEADKALVKSIWASSIEKCYRKELPVFEQWLDPETGLDNFAAFFASQRKRLQDMLYFNATQRASSFEQLKWLHTIDDEAGFYPSNISYTVPINTIHSKTGLFDMVARKGDKISKRALKGSKSKKAQHVTRKVSFTYEFWAIEEKVVIPTIHNLPDDVAVFINENSGRKLSLTQVIAEGGGSPYHGIIWLRSHPKGNLSQAIVESLKMVAKEMQENKKLDFNAIIKKMVKSFKKIPESVIRAIVLEKWTKYQDEFSLEILERAMKIKNSCLQPCTVWDSRVNYDKFESTELAAEALGYSIHTVRNHISTGKKTGNGLYITRGEVPQALDEENSHLTDLINLANVLHPLLKDRVSTLEEKVFWDAMRNKDLAITAKNFNLTTQKVAFMKQKFLMSLSAETNFLLRNESTTPPKVESVQTSPEDRPAQVKERFGVQTPQDGFDPCPNQGVFAHVDGAANNSNGKSTPEETIEELVDA